MDPKMYVTISIICALVMLVVVIINGYNKKKKKDPSTSVLAYLAGYSDKIVEIANQVSGDLKITQEDYDNDAETIKKKMINEIINSLSYGAKELGIDTDFIAKNVSNDALTDIIYTIVEDKLQEIIEANIKANTSTLPNDGKIEEPVKDNATTDSSNTTINSALNNFYNENSTNNTSSDV